VREHILLLVLVSRNC